MADIPNNCFPRSLVHLSRTAVVTNCKVMAPLTWLLPQVSLFLGVCASHVYMTLNANLRQMFGRECVVGKLIVALDLGVSLILNYNLNLTLQFLLHFQIRFCGHADRHRTM